MRNAAKLSLLEAATRSGLSHGHIRELEKITGKAENMTASTMRGLAVAYRVTIEQIVRIATGMAAPPNALINQARPALAMDLGVQ